MSESLVTDLAKELLNFEIPNVSAIIAGIDPTGAHIYTVYNNEARCVDNVGFAAIGIGARHASSQFMFARHAWNSPFPQTLLLTYYAKKKAEVAPGVGIGTDMVMTGPNVNSLVTVGDHVIVKLEEEYQKIIRVESSAFAAATGVMNSYVEELTKKAAEAAGDQQAAPKSNGGTAPSDDSKKGEHDKTQEKE